jgi:hypothetical protein
MAASRLTPNLLLPQFDDDDKPSWLGDFNGAMLKIDNAKVATDLTIATLQAQLNAALARITALETA